jgi:hypothetical protein
MYSARFVFEDTAQAEQPETSEDQIKQCHNSFETKQPLHFKMPLCGKRRYFIQKGEVEMSPPSTKSRFNLQVSAGKVEEWA